MIKEKLALTTVGSKQGSASCMVCLARNYDSAHSNALGERVERLYELRIGVLAAWLCDDCLDQLGSMIAAIQHERDGQLKAGDEVWIVERDEDGVACEVSGYMLLAKSGDYAIVSGYINGMEHLNGIIAYHIRETVENYDTDLAVFPAEDCYATREAAHAALREEKGDNDDEPEN